MTDSLPRLASKNPIRNCGGILDLTEPLAKHVGPLVAQLESGKPHEREFELFASFGTTPGLFVDVGANIGQSAISLRCVNHSLRILSLEPNPVLEPLLRYVRDRLLDDFEYRMVGCSDRAGSLDLWIPVVDNAYVTPLASTRREIFDRQADRDRLLGFSLDGRYELRKVPVTLTRLDDLELTPTVVKIDAEEHELQCVQGMVETLRRAQPLCMLEHNSQTDAVIAYLATLGYRPFLYDPQARKLVPYPAPVAATNVFYVPPSAERLQRLGIVDAH